MKDCKKIFAIHTKFKDGYIGSKYISKGEVFTDYGIFSIGSCILAKLDDSSESSINTPVGLLSKGKIYYIDKNKKIDITEDFHFPYKNVAGICYFIPEKIDNTIKPKNFGFNLYNWESESFEYCQKKDRTVIVNPDKSAEECPDGPSGVIKSFDSCNHGLGFK